MFDDVGNSLAMGAIFCTIMYVLIGPNIDLAPALVFTLSALGAVAIGWLLLN